MAKQQLVNGARLRLGPGRDTTFNVPEFAINVTEPDSAIERALAYGVDISLLTENLRLTPTERVRRGEQFLRSVLAFKNEVARARQAQQGKP